MDTINQLILNECYLENVDTYRHVSVFDIDETVIANLSPQFLSLDEIFNFTLSPKNVTCDRFDDSKNARFDRFLDVVKNRSSTFREHTSYFVNQGYYLDHEFMVYLFLTRSRNVTPQMRVLLGLM
jgi:hypothetical protein